MRGRKPTPDPIKELTGNPGKRPLNSENKPRPKQGRPKPPKVLTGPALREWKRIVPLLEEVNCLAALDRYTLASYCEWVGVFEDAVEMIKHDGLTTISTKGGEKSHPAVGILRQASEEIRKASALFGLSPSDRSRIIFQPKDDQDLFEEFMQSGTDNKIINLK